MTYTKHTWVNVPEGTTPPNGAPALAAGPLNEMEQGVFDAHVLAQQAKDAADAATLPDGDAGQLVGFGPGGVVEAVDAATLATDAPPDIVGDQSTASVGDGAHGAAHGNHSHRLLFRPKSDQTGAPSGATYVGARMLDENGNTVPGYIIFYASGAAETPGDNPEPTVSGAFVDAFDRADSATIGNGWSQLGEIAIANNNIVYTGPDAYGHGGSVWRKVTLATGERLKYVGVRFPTPMTVDEAWYGHFLFGYAVDNNGNLADGYDWVSNRIFARGIPDEPNAPVYSGFSPAQGISSGVGVRYNVDGTFSLMGNHDNEVGGEWYPLIGQIPHDANHLWFGFSFDGGQASHTIPPMEFVVEVESL